VTRGLERTLQRERQRLVRAPSRLTASERGPGRVRGKSDLIDALAIARAALRSGKSSIAWETYRSLLPGHMRRGER
jgi:hypothetical protein